MADSLQTLKEDLFEYIELMLGGGMVDVELDPKHYEHALKQAIRIYRQRSERANEESYVFLQLEENVNEYQLPNEIQTVRQIFRRNIGSTGGSNASQFEPFEAGFMNMYMLQGGRVGGLLNYELYAGYQEIASRMFGGYVNFTFNSATKKLTIIRRPRGSEEEVLLWVYNYKPDITLLTDQYTYPWIRDYTLAVCKGMLGEAREKFATIAGPAGGTSLNGTSLKQESKEEVLKLLDDINNFVDGGLPLSFIIG